MIDRLLAVGMSEWEEKVLAAACLAGIEIEEGTFADDTMVRLSAARERLYVLPADWIREIAVEVLVQW